MERRGLERSGLAAARVGVVGGEVGRWGVVAGGGGGGAGARRFRRGREEGAGAERLGKW